MVQRQIEKVVAAQLLDATKGVLDHLSQWQNRLNQTGERGPPNLSQIYGAVRRLRDYMQRLAISSYTREVPLDLSPEEENLLVSCAVHHIGCIDLSLQKGRCKPQDKQWLESVRQGLSSWSVRLASKPVVRIPSPDAVSLNTPSVRSVIAAIARSTAEAAGKPGSAGPARPRPPRPAGTSAGPTPVYPSGGGRPGGAPQPSAPGGGPSAGPRPVYAPGRGPVPDAQAPDVRPGNEFYDTGAPPAPAGGGRSGYSATAGIDPFGDGSVGSMGSAASESSGPLPVALGPAPGGAGVPVAASAPGGESVSSAELLLDPRLVRDPRLRTMIAMDAGALERTTRDQQYRLAMVHLASVLEGVVIDYALTRQKQLDIVGLPETWKIERILDKCMGDRLTSMDRPCLLQLVAARHLVRPAIQLNSPMVVTAATLEKSADFVRRVLNALGYTSVAPAAAEEELAPPPGTGPTPVYGPPASDADGPAATPPWLSRP